jgi:hypothetical protein
MNDNIRLVGLHTAEQDQSNQPWAIYVKHGQSYHVITSAIALPP